MILTVFTLAGLLIGGSIAHFVFVPTVLDFYAMQGITPDGNIRGLLEVVVTVGFTCGLVAQTEHLWSEEKRQTLKTVNS